MVGSDKIVAAIAMGLVKYVLVVCFKDVSDGPMDPAIALVHSLWQYAYTSKPDTSILTMKKQSRILNF